MATIQKDADVDTDPALKPGARITGEDREKMSEDVVRLYRRGMSVRDIAKTLGRSYGFVHRLLGEQDEPVRSRGGDTRGGSKELDGEQQRDYRERLEVLNRKRR